MKHLKALETNFPMGTTENTVSLESGTFQRIKEKGRRLLGMGSDGSGAVGGINPKRFDEQYNKTIGDKEWLDSRELVGGDIKITSNCQFYYRNGKVVSQPLAEIKKDHEEVNKRLQSLLKNCETYYKELGRIIDNFDGFPEFEDRVKKLDLPANKYQDNYKFLGLPKGRGLLNESGFYFGAFRNTGLSDVVIVTGLKNGELDKAVKLLNELLDSHKQYKKTWDGLRKHLMYDENTIGKIEESNENDFPLLQYFSPAGATGVSVLLEVQWGLITSLYRYIIASTK